MMKFDKQFLEVKKKLVNTVQALICVRDSLNYRAKLLIYNSLFKAHIDYSAIAYLERLSKTQLDELSKLQKNAIRLVFSTKRSVHTNKLFKLANIRPIANIYEEEAIKFVFKFINDTNDEQPQAIGKILFQGNTNLRNLRYYDYKSNIKICDKFKKGNCLYNLLHTWNQTDYVTKSAGNFWSLKAMLKEKLYIEDKTCQKENCYICSLDANKNYNAYMKN